MCRIAIGTVVCCLALTVCASVRTERDICYRNDVACLLDIRVPDSVTGFPTVVWFHGGGLTAGKRQFLPFGDSRIAQVCVDYRLMSETNSIRAAACIDDAAAAVAWTLDNISRYGGDTNQVYVAGHSAGGYLTMMVGMDPQWLARYGHTNLQLAGLVPISGQVTTHFNVRRFSGDKDPRFKPKIDEWAPLSYVSASLPPILSICGTAPYEWKCRSEENALMIASCKALGNPKAWFVALPFANHGQAYSFGVSYLEEFVHCNGSLK